MTFLDEAIRASASLPAPLSISPIPIAFASASSTQQGPASASSAQSFFAGEALILLEKEIVTVRQMLEHTPLFSSFIGILQTISNEIEISSDQEVELNEENAEKFLNFSHSKIARSIEKTLKLKENSIKIKKLVLPLEYATPILSLLMVNNDTIYFSEKDYAAVGEAIKEERGEKVKKIFKFLEKWEMGLASFLNKKAFDMGDNTAEHFVAIISQYEEEYANEFDASWPTKREEWQDNKRLYKELAKRADERRELEQELKIKTEREYQGYEKLDKTSIYAELKNLEDNLAELLKFYQVEQISNFLRKYGAIEGIQVPANAEYNSKLSLAKRQFEIRKRDKEIITSKLGAVLDKQIKALEELGEIFPEKKEEFGKILSKRRMLRDNVGGIWESSENMKIFLDDISQEEVKIKALLSEIGVREQEEERSAKIKLKRLKAEIENKRMMEEQERKKAQEEKKSEKR